jgi:hypothetical protein
MRFTEFKALISEAAIDPNTFAPSERNRGRNSNYYRNLITLIRDGSPVTIHGQTKPVIFKKSVADELESIWNPTGIDRNEEATPEQVVAMKKLRLTANDGKSFSITNIEKTKDIKQKTGEEGEEAFTKWWNKGNVAEGIMACAVITKFNQQGAEITADQVLETVRSVNTQIVPVLDKDGNPAMDKNGTPKERRKGVLTSDTYGKELSLTITLSNNDFAALLMSAKDQKTFEKYEQSDEVYQMYEDCSNYVNQSDNVVGAIEKIKNAAAEDRVDVTADGATAEAQHSTKADLWIAVGGNKERLLSIKTSTVKHIGAVSGYEFEHISKFFESTIGFGLPEEFKEKFRKPPAAKFLPNDSGELTVPNPEYVKMSRTERSAAVRDAMNYNYTTATREAYQWVFDQIQDRLAGNSDDQEYDFVKTVADGVVHHATLGDDIRLVIISPSAKKSYTELQIGNDLAESLSEFDLSPKLDLKTNYRILVYGYPVSEIGKRVENDKALFVQLRSYIQDGAARNVVEIGGLLKKLTDVTKVQDHVEPATVTPTKGTTPAKAPVKPKEPATPVNVNTTSPQMTNLQGTSFTSDKTSPFEIPDEEEHAMYELKAVLKNAGLLN